MPSHRFLESLGLIESEARRGAAVRGAPARLAAALVGAYHLVLSPLLAALFGMSCRFEPSCSLYAREALLEHGLIGGGALALRRLLRCHPLGAHGYDPVPRRRSSKFA